MKRTVALILVCLLSVCLFGCNDDQKGIYSQFHGGSAAVDSLQSPSPAPGTEEEELAGELTLYVSYTQGNLAYEDIVKQFQEKYPKIQVTLKGPETGLDKEAYTLQTTVALMSGEDIDLIDLAYLPYFNTRKADCLKICIPTWTVTRI